VSIDSFSLIRSGNSEKSRPFSIIRKNISNNLSCNEITRSFENFDFLVSLIGNADMINCGSGNNGQNLFINPFPENDIFIEFNVFELGFFVHVKDLKYMSFSFIRGFKGNDVVFDVHDGTINFVSWSLDNVHLVEYFNDAELWGVGLINISNTNISFRFEVSNVELEEFRVNTQVGKLEDLS